MLAGMQVAPKSTLCCELLQCAQAAHAPSTISPQAHACLHPRTHTALTCAAGIGAPTTRPDHLRTPARQPINNATCFCLFTFCTCTPQCMQVQSVNLQKHVVLLMPEPRSLNTQQVLWASAPAHSGPAPRMHPCSCTQPHGTQSCTQLNTWVATSSKHATRARPHPMQPRPQAQTPARPEKTKLACMHRAAMM